MGAATAGKPIEQPRYIRHLVFAAGVWDDYLRLFSRDAADSVKLRHARLST